MDLLDTQLFSLIGQDGFTRLVAAFYRQIPADDVLGPLYQADDLAGAEARLRGFLVQRFGGPDAYSQARGHPRLRMRHAPFKVDRRARDRWMALMNRALEEVQLPAAAETILRPFFENTATFMMNHDG